MRWLLSSLRALPGLKRVTTETGSLAGNVSSRPSFNCSSSSCLRFSSCFDPRRGFVDDLLLLSGDWVKRISLSSHKPSSANHLRRRSDDQACAMKTVLGANPFLSHPRKCTASACGCACAGNALRVHLAARQEEFTNLDGLKRPILRCGPASACIRFRSSHRSTPPPRGGSGHWVEPGESSGGMYRRVLPCR